MHLSLPPHKTQSPPPLLLRVARQRHPSLEDDPYIFPLPQSIPPSIPIVHDISLFLGENGVIATHATILAGVPMRAALAKDDVARYDKFCGGAFGTESFTGALRGFVGPAFGGVRGCPGRLEGLSGWKKASYRYRRTRAALIADEL